MMSQGEMCTVCKKILNNIDLSGLHAAVAGWSRMYVGTAKRWPGGEFLRGIDACIPRDEYRPRESLGGGCAGPTPDSICPLDVWNPQLGAHVTSIGTTVD